MCGVFCSAELIEATIILLVLLIIALGMHHYFNRAIPRRLAKGMFASLLVLAFLLFIALVAVRSLGITLAGQGTHAPPVPDLLSVVLAVSGVILTLVMGLSVVAAWRALDEAQKAKEQALDANRLISNRTLELARLAACIEADDRARQAQEIPGMRRSALLRVELVRLFLKSDVTDLLVFARVLLSRQEIFPEVGPEGLRFFEALEAREDLSRDNRRVLRQILQAAG
jgi:hypothetical protein